MLMVNRDATEMLDGMKVVAEADLILHNLHQPSSAIPNTQSKSQQLLLH